MNGFIEEICTQAPIMKECLRRYQNEDAFLIQKVVDCYKKQGLNKIILTGMGSSLYAMDGVRSYFTQHGIPALSFSAFELSRYQFQQIDKQTLVVVISQSGTSWEAIEIAQKAKQITTVLGIHNAPGCLLAQNCHFALDMYAGKEVSISNKSHELTMLLLAILAHALTDDLSENFYRKLQEAIAWCDEYLNHYEAYTEKLYAFAKDADIYDFIANNTSLATARQAALIYREGLHANTASWECADYAHGQYHGVKPGYLGIMLIPEIKEGTKEEKMFHHILDNQGKLLLITSQQMPMHDNLISVYLPRSEECIIPLMESIVTDCLLGMLLGTAWYKGK